MGEVRGDALRIGLDLAIKPKFHSERVSSDADLGQDSPKHP